MKKFKIMVELKDGSREEMNLEAEDRDQARRVLEDSFPDEVLQIEFLDEEEIDMGPEEIDYMDKWHRQKELNQEMGDDT